MIYKVCDFFNNQKVQCTLVTFKVQQKCINVQCIFYTKSIVFVYQMVYIVSRLCCEHLPEVRLPCASSNTLRFRILWASQAICLSPSSSVTPTRIMNPGPICCGSNVGSSVPNSLTTSTDASDTRCNTTFMVPYSTTCTVTSR